MSEIGVVTIAFGEAYQRIASNLIASLSRHAPGLRIAAITDRDWSSTPRPDEVLVRALPPELEGSVYGWKARFLYEAPFERVLYLDPDVTVTQDLRPLFRLLDHYDAGFRFFGPPLKEDESLHYHPKVHGGVILFKRCGAVEELFRSHLELYTRRVAEAEARGRARVVDDERTLAITLARSRVRPVHLDNYVAFHVGELNALWHPPLLYHGKLRGIEEKHAALVRTWPDTTEDVTQRLWLPRVAGFVRAATATWDDPFFYAFVVARKVGARLRSLLRGEAV